MSRWSSAQRAGRQPGTAQRGQATEMITESDNEAASGLWDAIGGAGGLAQANRRGVPRAAGSGLAVYVKNGWLASVTDRGRWIVNSVGRVVEPRHDWLVAVLSDRNPSEAAGISLVEHLARTALTGLRAVR
jgi:hypothetical protein